MGTRSAIGYRQPSGVVRAVYCHWDGYPSHQMPILQKHYNTLTKVKALIRPGSMSTLRTRNTWDNGKTLENGDGSPMVDTEGYIISENDRDPQPLYHSERGEKDTGPLCSYDPIDMWFRLHDCEHLYIFEPSTKKWTHIAERDEPTET